MTYFLIDDEDLFMKRLVHKAHMDMFQTEDDRQLQERMRRENAEMIQNKLLDSLVEIGKSKSKPGEPNWEYLKANNPKRYVREQAKAKKKRVAG